jgi:hypothetical protein
MVLGTLAECARWFRDLPRELRVSVVPDASALVPALAAGACDWIVWPSGPTEEAAAWCTQVVYRRPLAAGCTVDPASGWLEVLLPGSWIAQALARSPSRDGLSPLEARTAWLSAWAELLAAEDLGGDARDGVPARDLLLACMIRPSTGPLEEALGLSLKYLELERKRLSRLGFRGPGHLALVARVVLAWEGLRGGGQPPADVAHAVGYSGLPALDRALVKVAGVAARELAGLTDIELAPRLRAGIRRGVDLEKGKEGAKKG